jgi:hypothetical protein
MHDHMKKLLNISGITKRNHNLLWISMGKVYGYTLIWRLVYPSIGTLVIRYPNNLPEINALAPALCRYLFKHPDSMMPF